MQELRARPRQIKNLQEQSFSMSIKLRNRKAAESHLGQFVEDLTVPPKLITNVLESEVRHRWRAVNVMRPMPGVKLAFVFPGERVLSAIPGDAAQQARVHQH